MLENKKAFRLRKAFLLNETGITVPLYLLIAEA